LARVAGRSSSTRHSGLLYGDVNSRQSRMPSSGPGGDPGGRRMVGNGKGKAGRLGV
jgi:hypothetical protein